MTGEESSTRTTQEEYQPLRTKYKRNDDGSVSVQVGSKNATCTEGNVGCAFARALHWYETGRTIDSEDCVTGFDHE
jgi:hypothetical protein